MTGVIDVNNLPDYYNLFQLNLGDSISEKAVNQSEPH